MTEAAQQSGEGLPRLVVLGDGTAVVAGRRGEIRLSQDRKRWWNGVLWEAVATSTPPEALRNQAGTEWWDGEAWRPLAAVRGWYEAPIAVVAFHAIPLALIIPAVVAGGIGYWALAVIAYVAWAVVVARSRLLTARAKGLYLFSIPGIGLETLLSQRQRRSRDSRVATSAARL